MLKLNAENVQVSVFTYKEGVLSAVAHDLKFEVSKFEIATQMSASGGDLAEWNMTVKAAFDASSLKTVCAMKDGEQRPGVLTASDRRDIEKNIAATVLKTERFPRILFSSTGISGDLENLSIKGKLTLCGVTRTVVVPVVRQKGRCVAEAVLDQRNFGIKPFSAFFGAMKVKPEIKVRVSFSGLF